MEAVARKLGVEDTDGTSGPVPKLTLTEDEVDNLVADYVRAVSILKDIKATATVFARSGNPGRRSAGLTILSLLEPSA